MSRTASTRAQAAQTWLRFYVARSLALDVATLRLHRWPRASRAAFLASKAAALPALQAGRPAPIRVGATTFTATSPLDLGSLQSCLIDVHDEIVVPGLLEETTAPVVLDVGANVGQFATAVAAFFPAARIVSIEPDPDIHARLAVNAAARTGSTTRCAAVGDQPGTLTLHRHHLSLMSSLRPGAVETYDPDRQIQVEVLPLDDIAADLPDIDLLKIDVEGYEMEALAGAREVLGRTRYLLLEVGLGRELGSANLEVLARVRELVPGARIARFGRPLGDGSAPICQDVLLELHPPR